MKPLLSVVVPVLNEEKYLPKLLQDLVKQKAKNIEVIIVDAHSEDNTCEVAKKFNHKIDITIIQSKERNVSVQRNTGAKKAKGSYLFFCDADSRLGNRFIKDIRQVIEKEKYLLLLPSVDHSVGSSIDKMYLRFSSLLVELSQLTNKPFSNGGTLIIEKNFFKHIGGFNEELFLSEDHELVQRAYNCGVHAKFLGDIPYIFSLRRYKHEGVLNMLGKNSIAAFFTLLNGGVSKKMFEYEMGGARYDSKKYKKKVNELEKLYKKIFESI